MLSRLFRISTLLLVGITTFVIGAPIAETIESIKAVKIPQIRSGNLIPGVPGLPQCPDDGWPILITSVCLNQRTIRATCAPVPGEIRGRRPFDTPCPPNTNCMDFITAPGAGGALPFAICVDDSFTKSFDNNRKNGVFCKTYTLDDVTNDQATLSINVYDGTSNPVLVTGVSIDFEAQSGASYNTSNFSRIVNVHNKKDAVKVCMDVAIGGYLLYGMFGSLDGTYISS